MIVKEQLIIAQLAMALLEITSFRIVIAQKVTMNH